MNAGGKCSDLLVRIKRLLHTAPSYLSTAVLNWAPCCHVRNLGTAPDDVLMTLSRIMGLNGHSLQGLQGMSQETR